MTSMVTGLRPFRHVVVVAALLVLWTGVAAAQSLTLSTEIKRIRFDPSGPDGRGVALAGTGIAMPDDASAAITNPAALRLLVRSEIVGWAGGRFLDVDHLAGDPGPSRSPDDVPFVSSRKGYYEFGFAFAYPGRRLSAGAYYRVLSEAPDWFQYGASASYMLRDDLSIGGTLHIDQLTTSNARADSIEQLKPTVHLGILYSPTSRLHVGLVHRRGARHEMVDAIFDTRSGEIIDTREYALSLPDVTGAGFGARLTESTSALVEVSRTRYSQLAPGFAAQLLPVGASLADVTIEDSIEVRAAIEQAVRVGTKALAIRGGVWREHAHVTRYVGADPFWRAVFPDEAPRMHLTFGAGFSSERFGVNVGVDVARDFGRLVASAAARFR
jgi:hypothetical protein